MAAEVMAAEAGLDDPSAPDWILLLRGRGLPHGRKITILVELRQAEPQELAPHPTPVMMRAILELAERVTTQSGGAEVTRMSP